MRRTPMSNSVRRRSKMMGEGADIGTADHMGHQPHVAKAVEWHVKLLSGGASPADFKDFENWLRARPENATAYARLANLWDGMEPLRESEIVRETLEAARRRRANGALQGVLKPFATALRRLLSPRGAAAISGLAIAAVVAFNIVDPGLGAYRTALGERRTIELDDGSIIMLNTATAIRVSYGDDERRISLIDGQASFDVAKDASRPFIVNAGDGEVRALGTQFDVYKSDDAVTVTLIEGRVEIASTPARSRGLKPLTGTGVPSGVSFRAELSPGEQAAIAPAGPISPIAAVDINRVVAWREGKVNFRDTPLAEAVAEMNRYSSTKITLAGKDLEAIRVSGVFRTGNSKNFANALESLFDIRVKQNTRNGIVLLGAAANQQG